MPEIRLLEGNYSNQRGSSIAEEYGAQVGSLNGKRHTLLRYSDDLQCLMQPAIHSRYTDPSNPILLIEARTFRTPNFVMIRRRILENASIPVL